MAERERIIGIDLGTTNSVVAVMEGDNEPVEQETHLGLRQGDTLGWFTDCGDPDGG